MNTPNSLKAVNLSKKQAIATVTRLYREQNIAQKKAERLDKELDKKRLFRDILVSCLTGHTVASRNSDDHRGQYFFVGAGERPVLVKEFLEKGKTPKKDSIPVVDMSQTATMRCPFCKKRANVLKKTTFHSSNWDEDDFTYTTSMICFACENGRIISEISE